MTQPQRTITVGIGDQGALQLVDWVAAVAHSGDVVHLVHAYESWPYAATDWQLPVDNDDLLYAASARHVAYAAAALRRKRPDLVVDDEIVRCPSGRLLSAAASVVDLIVIGSPHRSGSRSALSQLAQHSSCPVLVIADQSPLTEPQHAPVTVMLRDLASDDATIEAGFETAAERRTGLIALRAWQPQADVSLAWAEAEEQLALDLFMAAWTPQFPAVDVSIQLRAGDACSVLREYAGDVPLLILGSGPATDSPEPVLDVLVDTALQVRHAPTLLIPSSSSQTRLALHGLGRANQPVS
jgi:nucleotide-binding universal stress UspA family protein